LIFEDKLQCIYEKAQIDQKGLKQVFIHILAY